MDICERLHTAKRDEAGGILEYNKLKSEMPAEHTEHIETIDNIIADEYDHLQEVELMIKELKCKDLTPTGEICIIAKEMYEKASEIEKKHMQVKAPEGEKVHEIIEEIEMKIKGIYVILKDLPMKKGT